MAKQRFINTKFWDDGWVSTLEPEEKLLYLYLLTNPLTTIAGAYEISERRIAFDTGIDEDEVQDILYKFAEAGKIEYRDGWILIFNFIKNQSNNPKIKKGIDETLNRCPDWIKDRVSKGIDRVARDTNNLNLNLNRDLKSSAIAAPATPEEPVGEKTLPTGKNHPAIVAILQNTSARPPKTIYDALISAIGDEVDTDRLKQCFTDWCMKGYNPQNFAWVTEWYAKGTKPKTAEEEMPQSNGRLPYDSWVFCAFAKSTPEEKILMYPKVRAEYLFQWPNTEAEINEYEQTAEYRENYVGAGQIGNGSVAATGRGTATTQSKVPISH